MVIGLNGRLPLNTAGNLQLRDDQRHAASTSHAAHLGNSPSEIDPTFALQAPHHVNPNTLSNPDRLNTRGRRGRCLVNSSTPVPQHPDGHHPAAQPTLYQTPSPTVNQDANCVMFGTDANDNQIYYYLPNSIADV